MAPSPLHLIEIWANEECTIRPIAGNIYPKLYVQINKDIEPQCPIPSYLSSQNGITYDICGDDELEGEEIFMTFSIDWTLLVIESYYEGVDLSLKKGVYAVSSDDAFLPDTAVLSDGPLINN